MFHKIPKPILSRMKELEEIDAQDRQDGTPHIKRLRQIPPETGRVLAFLAVSVPEDGAWLEIGTSAGYSALWLSLAARARGKKLFTFELLPEKVALARDHIGDFAEVAFCFMDCEKEMYTEVYELVTPNLVPDGLLVIDNILSHKEELEEFVAAVEADESLDVVALPVGKGLLVCRKLKE